MSSEPRIHTRSEQPAVAIPIQIRRAEMDRAVGLIGEVFGWLASRDIRDAGPVYFRYFAMQDDGDWLDMEVGALLQSAMSGDDRVRASSLPAGRYLTVIHHGAPDGLYQAHARLHEWREAAGLSPAIAEDGRFGGIFELYLSDPANQPDPNDWDTEILIKLAD